MGITREEFRDAVQNALDDTVDIIVDNNPNMRGAFEALAMSMLHMAFADLIEKHLFGDEPTEEDTTDK